MGLHDITSCALRVKSSSVKTVWFGRDYHYGAGPIQAQSILGNMMLSAIVAPFTLLCTKTGPSELLPADGPLRRLRARDAGDRRGEGRCRGGSGRGETRREDGQFATTGGFRPGVSWRNGEKKDLMV
ncbi:hypothetical protein F2P79_017791 [Pimephales promelas]|nr:hypothetical protein F2P79_017791 [Pimephales promelas]